MGDAVETVLVESVDARFLPHVGRCCESLGDNHLDIGLVSGGCPVDGVPANAGLTVLC
jgi:hypothetical protein